jgi:hypothetical protein
LSAFYQIVLAGDGGLARLERGVAAGGGAGVPAVADGKPAAQLVADKPPAADGSWPAGDEDGAAVAGDAELTAARPV